MDDEWHAVPFQLVAGHLSAGMDGRQLKPDIMHYLSSKGRFRYLCMWNTKAFTLAMALVFLPLAHSYPDILFETVVSGNAGTSVDGAVNPEFVASYNYPGAVMVSTNGELYVADTRNHVIRKISAQGLATTIAGSPGESGSADGLEDEARFNEPMGLAADKDGNLYVADSINATIRRISPAGMVSTLAGQTGVPGGADGLGASAQFNMPAGLVFDGQANLYVADANGIRRVSLSGEVVTYAGGGGYGSTDGTLGEARFWAPKGVALDSNGNLYVADTGNHTIRKISSDGMVSTVAGLAGVSGLADGVGGGARFNGPSALDIDAAGNLYVADRNNFVVRKITPDGVVSTLGGSLYFPTGLAVAPMGGVYVADTFNHYIVHMDQTGSLTVTTGRKGVVGHADGWPLLAGFNVMDDVVMDAEGNWYVSEHFGHIIKKISHNGAVAWAGAPGVSGADDGLGDQARFKLPRGLAIGPDGSIYVADSGNHVIRMVTPTGQVTTLAGTAGLAGTADGQGATARFNTPHDVAVAADGNLYVTDGGNHTIRKITPEGVVTTVAGQPGAAGSADGVADQAGFFYPTGIVVAESGLIYVVDGSNHTIRKITASGQVATLAGLPMNPGSVDGTGVAARFRYPTKLAMDPLGNLLVLDTQNHTIRKVDAAGAVVTIGGTAGESGAVDGLGMQARFAYPSGLTTDAAGHLYVAQLGSPRIAKGWLNTTPLQLESLTNRTLVAGRSFTLQVAAMAADTFQWRKDGVPIEGAITASLSLAGVTIGDAGAYDVVLGNRFGSVVSNVAVIRVLPVASSDFNADTKPDLIWSNSVTGERALWLMDGTSYIAASTLGIFPLEWTVAATGDFNADGKPDLVWSNSVTGERALWLMDGTNLLGVSTLGIFPLEWTVAATGDFNADGKPDLVWSNSVTGERALWLMDGTDLLGVSTLGMFPTEWTVAATGDFNADGKPDLVWSNGITGERALWLMDGTMFLGSSTLGVFPLEWTVEGVGDYNGDGLADLIWSNSLTGERALWMMNGTQFLSSWSLGIFPLEWTVSN
ncbi:MAG: FG-GAP repeat protein [Opitutaceae bacterium]|nr:FG-GAP repeat protein [Opitutaceae bacterium]